MLRTAASASPTTPRAAETLVWHSLRELLHQVVTDYVLLFYFVALLGSIVFSRGSKKVRFWRTKNSNEVEHAASCVKNLRANYLQESNPLPRSDDDATHT